MRRFVTFSLFVLSFSAVTFAQSGRKIAPTPTPTQSNSQQDKDETPTYSESKPNPKRSLSGYPNLKNIPKNETKSPLPSTMKDPEVLSDSEDDAVKVETNLISIPVSVFDRNGLYIPNLSKENFKIFEDGVEQQIEFFATTDNPFTVVLLLDTSPSTEFKIEEIQEAAIAFVDQLKPQDSVMVIEFDGNVHVLTEATTDRQSIYKGIKRADFGNGTSLYDAVDFSLRKRLSKIQGRKAIVLFTDGVDTTSSKVGYDSSLREAEEADATIFPIYYNTFFDNQRRNGGGIFTPFPQIGGMGGGRGVTSQEYALGRQYLKDLSESTGGRVFNAENTPGGLTRTFESIAEELRRQYSIGYIPQEAGQTGQRKQIKVRVDRPNLVIRARDSYIVGEQTKKPAPVPTKTK
ncbi:MAG TPA: VWA domain-containing protein [Pyrinomonadaceae bacterium]|jgi:VWFA-related protein|nr:VWA domain-containing protein [Pyrinomonadaceae bacterium]